MKTDVIIIGAGPTGLSLACQLIRYGIDFIIIEKKEGVTAYSKAVGVQARTLEIYEQLDLGHKAVECGQIASKIGIIESGKICGEVDLSNMGQGLSPYPYLLILEQSKNEQLLYEYLQNHQKEVLWKTELEHFSQNEAGVTVHIKTANGDSQIIKANYLVGCDGAKSPIRHDLGFSFEGSTLERLFYVADVQIDWSFGDEAGYGCLAPASTVLFFPMKGEKRYRIIGTFPEGLDKDEGEILYEEIEQHIKDDTKLSLDISNVNWFAVYKVHSRCVNKFSEGRCFLAGDSAHIHSPAGGQGMNTGIQDAYNLAWKIAFVLKGYSSEKLLESYNAERLANAQKLLESTDRAFTVLVGSNWFFSFLRTTIFPVLAKYFLRLGIVGKKLFLLVSQIRISYPDSPISDRSGDKNFKVKAGDRMPYFLIDGKSIYDRLHQPKFHMLTFSNQPNNEQMVREKIAQDYDRLVDYHALPLNPRVAEVFGVNESFSLLLRPDNYIGFISRNTSPDELEDYFAFFS